MDDIWNYWGLSDLNRFLTEIDNNLLDRLEVTLQGLEGHTYDPIQLRLKTNLIKIIEAFAPSDLFRNIKFRRQSLNRLPENVLFDLATKVNAKCKKDTFNSTLDCLVNQNWDDPVFSRCFIDFFSLPQHFLSQKKEKLPDFVDFFPPSESNPTKITSTYKTLKDFQFRLFQDCSEKINVPKARFIIQMPTGSGKTRTAMELIASVFNNVAQTGIVVWLAHSEELCEQAYLCFKEVWQHVGNVRLRSVRCWGDHPMPVSHDISMFIVGGFGKFYSALTNDANELSLNTKRIKLIIVDEAHKSVAPTYKQVIKHLIGDDTAVVGLTATPGRTIVEETEELAEFYFSDIVGLWTAEDTTPLAMLRKRGILSETEYVPMISGRQYMLTGSEMDNLKKHFDFSNSFLTKVGQDDIRNVEVLRRIQKECQKESSILFFACSVKHSRFISAMLIYLGISAAHLDGSTNKDRRAAIIDEFKKKKIKVLCNFGVLSTGFDAPNTDVVFISRPTGSAVLYSQMIGRGLRGPAIGGTEKCKIIDVKDNIIGFGNSESVYRYFDSYWQNYD